MILGTLVNTRAWEIEIGKIFVSPHDRVLSDVAGRNTIPLSPSSCISERSAEDLFR